MMDSQFETDADWDDEKRPPVGCGQCGDAFVVAEKSVGGHSIPVCEACLGALVSEPPTMVHRSAGLLAARP
jgi:hypothetical protein